MIQKVIQVPRIVSRYRFLVVSVLYIQKRASGALYYYRRIPKPLRQFYGGKVHIVESLKTRSLEEATKVLALKVGQTDAYWRVLESKAAGEVTEGILLDARQLVAKWGKKPGDGARVAVWPDEPHEDYLEAKYGNDYRELRTWECPYPRELADDMIESMLSPVENEALRLLFNGEAPPRHLLSDAMKVYLSDHENGGQPKFIADTERSIRAVVDVVGDLPLPEYTRAVTNQARDGMLQKGNATGTVARRIAIVCAVVTKGLREFELAGPNNFRGLTIRGEGKDAKKVLPFTVDELRTIAAACMRADDDIRHLIALQMDLGCRISEVAGLRSEDLFLDAPVPYVCFRFREDLGRSLKTANSERSVPLVGMALWAARRLPKRDGWLFPRYASDGRVKGDNASVTVNKWLQKFTPEGVTKNSHSFRHAMKDRLRAADVRQEIQEAIMGHGAKSIAQGYGAGYTVDFLRDRLALVAIDPKSL